jgi:hypothetical protein
MRAQNLVESGMIPLVEKPKILVRKEARLPCYLHDFPIPHL